MRRSTAAKHDLRCAQDRRDSSGEWAPSPERRQRVSRAGVVGIWTRSADVSRPKGSSSSSSSSGKAGGGRMPCGEREGSEFALERIEEKLLEETPPGAPLPAMRPRLLSSREPSFWLAPRRDEVKRAEPPITTLSALALIGAAPGAALGPSAGAAPAILTEPRTSLPTELKVRLLHRAASMRSERRCERQCERMRREVSHIAHRAERQSGGTQEAI